MLRDARDRNTALVFQTVGISPVGRGKSILLLNMIVQDITHGEGICVLDPHGDLLEQIIERIPEERAHDVVLLDPSDEAYSVGFSRFSKAVKEGRSPTYEGF